MSKPAQAISQCAAAWVYGRLRTRKKVQGTRTIPERAKSGPTHGADLQRGERARGSRSSVVTTGGTLTVSGIFPPSGPKPAPAKAQPNRSSRAAYETTDTQYGRTPTNA